MADVQFFGLNPGIEHAVNVLVHLANTVLLFLVLLEITGKLWRCALVAAIFGLHPLHVESVAWIAERKDVLSTFFEILTLFFYVRYAKARSAWNYALVALSFALSLMAKPMAVTWPFVLLLLDYWPLTRVPWPLSVRTVKPCIIEKVPLFLLAAFFSVLTLFTQKSAGAISTLDRLPLWARLENACTAYLTYVVKALWPANLAVLYPFRVPRADDVLLSLVVLLSITAVALKVGRSRPYVPVGWFWFVGMLVPVIGIVQVGNQAWADRYTYLPMVGLSIAVIWWLADIIELRPGVRPLAWALSVGVVAALGAQAYHVTAYWADSRSLFSRAVDITENNWTMDDNLAVILEQEKRYDEAAALWQKAITGNPAFEGAKANYAHMKNNLGVAREKEGKLAEATILYRDAVTINPNLAVAHGNLGSALLKAGQMDEAKIHLMEALRVNPNDPRLAIARGDLGFILAAQGKLAEARRHLEASLALEPKADATHSNLCWVLLQLGNTEEAIAQCREALNLNPANQAARLNLTNALAATKKSH